MSYWQWARGPATVFFTFLLSAVLPAQGTRELRFEDARGVFNGNVELPLVLEADGEVQGVVAAFKWDGTAGTGMDLVPAPVLDGADTVVVRVESDYMVLGVVLNTNPTDPGSPEVIPPGEHRLATVVIRCGAGPQENETTVEFADGEFAAVAGGPDLDNVISIAGESITVAEGLVLTNGRFRCEEPFDQLVLEDGRNSAIGPCGDVRVLMTNSQPVEGFVTSVCHDTNELELLDVLRGAAASEADFVGVELDPFTGATFGAVMDLLDPIGTPPSIPPGVDQHIVTYRYCCTAPPPPGQSKCLPIRFCDQRLGDPLKDNAIVMGGLSTTRAEGLVLVDGEFCCVPTEDCPPGTECCDDGIDNDGDGLVDLEDPDCRGASFHCGGRDLTDDSTGDGVPDVIGSKGAETEVCFYLTTLEDDVSGQAQLDHIQGFSMAVEYCCDVAAREDFDISGTILEALGAEFVTIQTENRAGDGDGCELIIGVLIDVSPPFEGGTIAPSPTPQRLGCVTFDVSEDAECGSTCSVEFVDGLNGRGQVPVRNLVAAENRSRSAAFFACQVSIVDTERFYRGDCNNALSGTRAVDIADAAALVSFLFMPGLWQFQPGCLDACDCNDDGRVDLADATCILFFLFVFPQIPPPPGPGYDAATGILGPPGPDPTPDLLDCELGRTCPSLE